MAAASFCIIVAFVEIFAAFVVAPFVGTRFTEAAFVDVLATADAEFVVFLAGAVAVVREVLIFTVAVAFAVAVTLTGVALAVPIAPKFAQSFVAGSSFTWGTFAAVFATSTFPAGALGFLGAVFRVFGFIVASVGGFEAAVFAVDVLDDCGSVMVFGAAVTGLF